MEVCSKPKPLSVKGNLKENWKRFKQEFEDLLVSMEWDSKSDKVKAAKLRNLIGPEGRERIEALGLQTSEDYSELISKLDAWAEPQKNITMERAKFSSRNQNPNESFDEYVSDLKRLISTCEYGTLKDEILKDRIVLGVADVKLKEHLLRISDLTLEKAEKLAHAVETAKASIAVMSSSEQHEANHEVNPVQKFRGRGRGRGNSQRSSNSQRGQSRSNQPNGQYQQQRSQYSQSRSGNRGDFNGNFRGKQSNYCDRNDNYYCKKCATKHGPRQCPAHNKECGRCFNLHHFARCCRAKNVNEVNVEENNNDVVKRAVESVVYRECHELVAYSPKASFYEARVINCDKADKCLETATKNLEIGKPAENANESQVNVLDVQDHPNVSSVGEQKKPRKEWRETIFLENVPVSMKLDPGSEVNTLPESIFKAILKKTKIPLEKTNEILGGIGHGVARPLGIVRKVDCKTSFDVRGYFDFYVTKDSDTKALLGIEACERLELVIRRVHSVSTNAEQAAFVEKNRDVFTGSGKVPGLVSFQVKPNPDFKILPPRRYPIDTSEKLLNKLNKLEKQEIVLKIPINEELLCVSNILVREKPDGDLRLCLDPKNLNECLITRKCAIPTVDEISAKLSGKKWFTVFDEKEAFYHFELDEYSSRLCAFNTPFGVYRFLRMPFGIICAAECCHERNVTIFGGIKGVTVYIDDILVANDTEKEHDESINLVIIQARKHNVKFKLSKLQYKQRFAHFTGFIFSEKGRQIDPERTRALTAIADPKNKKELMSIMGMLNYVRQFLPNLSNESAPLRELLKKDVEFLWTPYHSEVLAKLKKRVAEAPILSNFDSSQEIVLQSDASKSGIGACLMQLGRPVAYFSKALTETQTNIWGQIDKEFYAIIAALEKFYQFTYGRDVTVECDHKPISYLVHKDICKIKSQRLKKFRQRLYNFKVKIIFKPGRKMYIADLLSRQYLQDVAEDDPEEMEYVHSVLTEEKGSLSDLEELKRETENDPTLQILKEYLLNGWPNNKSVWPDNVKPFWKIKEFLYLEDGVIFNDERIVVPKAMKEKCLTLLHLGHFGISKTIAKATELYYWPVDYLSKWLEITKVPSHHARTVINAVKPIFATHGYPKEIICDNVPFGAREFKNFIEEHKGKVLTTSPNFPQAHGMIEIYVKIAKGMIKKSKESKVDLDEMLLEYRNMPLTGMKVSPAQILMSRQLRSKLPVNPNQLKPKVVNAREKFLEKQAKVKEQFDKSATRSETEFKAGDNVAVRKDKIWIKGIIVGPAGTPRSYIVQTAHGNLRRNTFHLKKSQTERFNPLLQQNDNYDFLEAELNDNTQLHNVIEPDNNVTPNAQVVNNALPNGQAQNNEPENVIPRRIRRVPQWHKDYVM
ncbi:uncharacterized protein [Bemisia tabaci]|uniref:uncharacterized protein n=1 Tax=Bemisia tabaci TaxID=7038 RepID=UPI003B28B330